MIKPGLRTTKVWFITGDSQRFGRILVDKLLVKNEKIVATSRMFKKFLDLKNNNFLGVEACQAATEKLEEWKKIIKFSQKFNLEK